MRICFVGHDFHRRTGSSAFFIEVLRSIGEVVEFYANPDGDPAHNDALARTLIESRFDRYIFWQTERIAERLLPVDLGLSFIVPMYDAVAHAPDSFWLKFVKHRFLSFTRCHHERLQRIGCATSYFQYFTPVGPMPERPIDGAALDAMFWERQPNGPINLASVLGHCRALGVERLHVHAAPDFATDAQPHGDGTVDGVPLSVSRWLESQGDYEALAGAPLFFFAPRRLEGIGMATLEAMARGQIVVAPNLPASNEYVAHLSTGLLYDPADERSRLPKLDIDTLRRMSWAARRKAVEGRRSWIADLDRLRSIIADDGRRWSTTDISANFVRVIRRAAHERMRHAG